MIIKNLVIAFFLLIFWYASAHAFLIIEGNENLYWSSDKTAEIDEGDKDLKGLPDDFKLELDETRWTQEPWQLLLEDGITLNSSPGKKLHLLNGKPITAFGYHSSGLIVATSQPNVTSVQINQVTEVGGNNVDAMVVFKEGKKLVEPDIKDIGFFDFQYNPVSFRKRTFKEVINNLSVTLLLDRSGSMDGYLAEATMALKTFAKNLQNGITCKIQSFNTTLQNMVPEGSECNKVWNELVKPQATGGSSIFTALFEAYKTAISQKKNGQKSIVIILTDGGAGDVALKSKVIEARKKADATTFIYWIGPVNKTSMTNVANYELTGNNKISEELAKYFSSIEDFIQAQLAYRMKAPTKTLDGIAQLKNIKKRVVQGP